LPSLVAWSPASEAARLGAAGGAGRSVNVTRTGSRGEAREAAHGMPGAPAVFPSRERQRWAGPAGDGGTLPGEIVLRDGTKAWIWPLPPGDGAVLRGGFAALSDRSRYRRFLSSVPELTEPMLRRLVDEVDGITTWR
jgi:hypothetical protein